MSFTFGTTVDPAHFVEVRDTAYVDPAGAGATAMKRPAAGAVLQVRDAATLADLAAITTQPDGYWTYVSASPTILVSGDGGLTWVGPLIGIEAQVAAATGGNDSAAALTAATAAQSTANTALTLAQSLAAGQGAAIFNTYWYPSQAAAEAARAAGTFDEGDFVAVG